MNDIEAACKRPEAWFEELSAVPVAFPPDYRTVSNLYFDLTVVSIIAIWFAWLGWLAWLNQHGGTR